MMDADQPTDFPSARRLILLRHGKSAYPPGVDDPQRPLSPRGTDDATAAGPELASIAVPDAVFCSPAARTRQTWLLVARAFDPVPPVRFEPILYGADISELLDVVRMVPDDATTALVIGHEPTMSATASALAGPGSSQADLDRMKTKYPTTGMAVLRFDGNWCDLEPAGAALERFLVPRG